MRRRISALSILAIGALGACSPVATLDPYSPSDGVRVALGDDMVFSNLMVLSEAAGEAGYLVGGFTNRGGVDTIVSVDAGSGIINIEVAAGQTVIVTPDQSESIIITEVSVPPGANLPLQISTTSYGSTAADVPVLDGTLPYYGDFFPVTGPEN